MCECAHDSARISIHRRACACLRTRRVDGCILSHSTFLPCWFLSHRSSVRGACNAGPRRGHSAVDHGLIIMWMICGMHGLLRIAVHHGNNTDIEVPIIPARHEATLYTALTADRWSCAQDAAATMAFRALKVRMEVTPYSLLLVHGS